MQSITFKEFCDLKGYNPNNKPPKNLSTLANIIGVSISHISKLYNARITGTNGPAWDKVSDYIGSFGYNLISANQIDFIQSNVSKENKKLKNEIKNLKAYINVLELQLNDIQELVRISSKIHENKNNLKELKTSCRL